MRRVFWILITPLAILCAIAVGLRYYIVPRLEVWGLTELQNYSEKNLTLQIRADKLNIHFFKPSVALEGVTVNFKEEIAETVALVTAKSVRAHLDMFQLLAGRLQLSAVVIDSPRLSINLDPLLEADTKSEPLPLDAFFSLTEKIPLDRIFAQNISLRLNSVKKDLKIEVENGGLLITNMGKNLTLKTELPDLKARIGNLNDMIGSFDAHLYLTRQSLKIIQLGAHLSDSEIVARGELSDFKNVTINPQGVLNLSTTLTLSDVYREIKRLKPDLKVPSFDGSLEATTQINFKGFKQITAEAQIKTQKIVIGQFQIGDASLQGKLNDDTIKISEFKVSHPAGNASLDESELQLNRNFQFKTKIQVSSLKLQKLFVSLGLNSVPMDLDLKGTLPCRGQFADPFFADCDGKLQGENLWVRGDLKKPSTEIVAIENLSAEGNVKIDMKSVAYKAKISMGDSLGSSDGVISYATGFKINYKTDLFDFKNLKNLSGLHFVGTTTVEGSTEGSSDGAMFNMRLDANNFVFEKFQLGNITTDLHYSKGHLVFENLGGAQNKTQYLGTIEVDLTNSQIRGQIRLPIVDLADVTKVFEQIYKFPVSVSGLGIGNISFDGPLNFWKMNYQLQSQFKNFLFGSESFDSLQLNAEAKNGNINAKEILIKKNASSLVLTGGISSEQSINLIAEAKTWRLEESDIVSRINSNIFGILNGVAEITGTVAVPEVQMRGSITETVIEEQEIPKSNFSLKVDKTKLDVEISLFGDKIIADILMPLGDRRSAFKVKVSTNDWQFSSLLAILGGGSLVNEYDSALTSEINLSSESGDILKSTGTIEIKKVYLKRGKYSLRNRKPVGIQMTNGNMSFKNFFLEGQQNKIQVRGENFTSDNLNINIVADVELRLLHMFLPFLEDLGGSVQTTASISGSVTNPQILGNLDLENGFFKIKGFPHPLEKIQSDVSFSHTRVLINAIKGQLAGGAITGAGSILIKGPRELETNIRAHADSVTFNVPAGVRTSGEADLLISGNWFPFTLSGTYKVANAFIDKEFGGDSGMGTGLRKSVYLPKVLSQLSFEPLLLDLQVLLNNNIILKNSLVDGLITGNLRIKGPPDSPILLGRVNFEKNSRLIFKDKVFEVQAGQVQFSNPNEIDPEIYVSAQSRVSDYDVTLLVQGTSKAMNIHVSSQPPLSDQNIISLLALGVTSTKLDQNVQSKDQQAQTSYEIGAAIIGAPINRRLESTLGLSFQFSSSFDTTRNINVPKVTLSRKISERVSASASRILGDQSAYDVKLQYLINQNVSVIGSFEKRDSQDGTLRASEQDSQGFFGLDLEFKREFK